MVIATDGAKRDGRLTVINSSAGDLRPRLRARLHLPALSAREFEWSFEDVLRDAERVVTR